MAKITRKTGNVVPFGSNATGTNRTIFGPDTQSDTLDDNVTSEFLEGWEIVGPNENPKLQDYNALGYTQTLFIAYLHQMGMAEWDGAQEYQIQSLAARPNGIYFCKTANHTSVTIPESDATNWFALSITDPTVTGSTVFTQSTNNIGLTGIGSIGLAVGDVIRPDGSSNNDKDFTVEVITDANNIIVNQAHAGGTSKKSLVNETVSTTITLVARAKNAPLGLGQGVVDLTSVRSQGTVYTNDTERTIEVYVIMRLGSAGGTVAEIDGKASGRMEDPSSGSVDSFSIAVPKDSTYEITSANTKTGWVEIR